MKRMFSELRQWSTRGAGLWVFCACLTVRADVTAEEQSIVRWLAGRDDEMVALLADAVKIDSATENLAGVRAVAELFSPHLQQAGLAPRWIPLPASTRRAGHLFAERTGAKGKRLLLIGHLDTVLHSQGFVREGDTARGVGANDIKGGDVVLLYALKALHAVGALDGTQIIVALTGDEESLPDTVEVSRRELINAGKRSDIALAFETARKGEGTVARRGASSWRLEVESATGHSSGVFSAALGSGAIYEAARIIDGFHSELQRLPGLTANVALIAGGSEVKADELTFTAQGKHNVIPARAVAQGDLRAVSPEQLGEAEALMRTVLQKNRPRAQPTLTLFHRYPPMAAVPRNLAVLAVYDQLSRDLGH